MKQRRKEDKAADFAMTDTLGAAADLYAVTFEYLGFLFYNQRGIAHRKTGDQFPINHSFK